MTRDSRHSIRLGSVCAYAFFYVYIVSIGVGATLHWRWLDLTYAFVGLGAVAVGSIAVIWRAWKHRNEPGGIRLGQMAALPHSWRKWMLGETGDRSGK